MPFRLASQASDFETAFEQLLALKRELSEDVEAAVRDIIADVVVRGVGLVGLVVLRIRRWRRLPCGLLRTRTGRAS